MPEGVYIAVLEQKPRLCIYLETGAAQQCGYRQVFFTEENVTSAGNIEFCS